MGISNSLAVKEISVVKEVSECSADITDARILNSNSREGTMTMKMIGNTPVAATSRIKAGTIRLAISSSKTPEEMEGVFNKR